MMTPPSEAAIPLPAACHWSRRTSTWWNLPHGRQARPTSTETSLTMPACCLAARPRPPSLFINLNNGKIGEVGTRDAVVFDEIANTDFTDPKALVSIMQGYMQDAKFSRGKKEMLAFASLVFVGKPRRPREDASREVLPLVRAPSRLPAGHGVPRPNSWLPARLGDS